MVTPSLPTGGGAVRGMGESFQAQEFSGTATYSIPLPLPRARALTPELRLAYGSGGGNGIFGLGFAVALPSVARKTSNGIPRYTDDDVFIFSEEGELAPVLLPDPHGDGWIADVRLEPATLPVYRVTAFRTRREAACSRIERWARLDTGDAYWQVRTRENVLHTFGSTPASRVADPDDPTRVFQWLVDSTVDARGNACRYGYRAEDGAGIVGGSSEDGHDHRAARYPDRVDYGNYTANGEERFAFSLVFDYGERSLADPDAPPATWALRPDPFSSYRAGFELRTLRRCQALLAWHCFHDQFGGAPFLTRALALSYQQANALDGGAPAPDLSLLVSTTEIGFRRDGGGAYTRRAMPPLSFGYTAFDPASQPFQPLEWSGSAVPGPLGGGQYLTTDLQGDGLPGFLYGDGTSALQWEPRGAGQYEGPAVPDAFPIEGHRARSPLVVSSLDGNGEPDLLVRSATRAGYYPYDEARRWGAFTPFGERPLELVGAPTTMVDLDGDGRADLLAFAGGELRAYRSRGLDGFAAPEVTPPPPDFPMAEDAGLQEVLTFADLLGDGLSHRVRIRDGSVECWPNLGYGRFGARVVLDNAPTFGGAFDARRLFLADVAGTGTSDLVYVDPDAVRIFFNESGNRFSDPLVVPLPVPWDALTRIAFTDVTGNGTASLVVTRLAPDVVHHFCDLAGPVKPFLLATIDTNRGGITRVTYTTSAKQYLADRQAGRDWATRLHFPVQVVASVEQLDQVTGSRHVMRRAYHDGYYDPDEREFRGFGFVESWDADDIAEPPADGARGPGASPPSQSPPAFTRSWFHTGAFLDPGVISRHYAAEYWAGDALAPVLAESTFDPAIFGDDARTVREAYVALAGECLRQELFGLDGTAAAATPFQVTESRFSVRLLQPCAGSAYAAFLPWTEESVAARYERVATDPRITHDVTLAVDAYGNATRRCTLAYPRRAGGGAGTAPVPEQLVLLATVTEDSFANHEESPAEPWRFSGVPVETRASELQGLDPGAGGWFTFGALATQAGDALTRPLDYGAPFTAGLRQARLLSWTRRYQWNAAQDAAAPLGVCSPRGLSHHQEDAVAPIAMLDAALGSRLTAAEVAAAGYWPDAGYWWNRALIQRCFTDPARYFLPCQTDGTFDGVDPEAATNPVTVLGYDAYALLPLSTTRWLTGSPSAPGTAPVTLTTRVDNDYQALCPIRSTDANGVVSEVLLDPLRLVVATSLYGLDGGAPAGDTPLASYVAQAGATIATVIADPDTWLQQATSFFFYDLLAWSERAQPVAAVALMRQVHVHALAAGAASPVQVELAYTDGFGRLAESKLMTDFGAAEAWIVSGRTTYDAKGLAVQQFLPAFSPVPDYEGAARGDDGGIPPATLHYDALGRLVRTDTPKGFFSTVTWGAWEVTRADENDTVKDSLFYLTFPTDPVTQPEQDERDALDKAAACQGTPAVEVLDALGRTVRTIADRGDARLTTLRELDAAGREVALTDPRLAATNAAQGTSYRNFTRVLDMAGHALVSTSADAGCTLTLLDTFGEQYWSRSARAFEQWVTFDRLRRKCAVRVKGYANDGTLASDTLAETFTYGDSDQGAEANNLRGRVVRQCDQSGVVDFTAYGIAGDVRQCTRQLTAAYDCAVDWSAPPLLETDRYTSAFTFNAVRAPVSEVAPDGTVTRRTYYRAGLLATVTVTFADGTVQGVIDAIGYDATRQRTSVSWSSGVTTTRGYEPTTQRLVSLSSTRSATDANGQPRATLIQDVRYTWDPVGNVTRTRDASFERVFHANQQVDALSDYAYDPLYQVVAASGRQHAGVTLLTWRNDAAAGDFKQSRYCQVPGDGSALENYQERYTYDDAGNLVGTKHLATNAWTRTLTIAPGSNRIVTSTGANGTGYANPISYDPSGNPRQLFLDTGVALTWNCCERMVSAAIIQRPGEMDDADYYTYDRDGQRTRKVAERMAAGGGVVERSERIYLGSYEVERVSQVAGGVATPILLRRTVRVIDEGRAVAVLHTWDIDSTKREVDQPGTRRARFQLPDRLGSSALEVDAGARIISYEEYFPYGGTAFIGGTDLREVSLKEYRYCGKVRDDSTGLYYYGARYYAPWLGRWLTPDPIGPGDGVNLFAFVAGNPLRYEDPRGTSKQTVRYNLRSQAKMDDDEPPPLDDEDDEPEPESSHDSDDEMDVVTSSYNPYLWEVTGIGTYHTSDSDLHEVTSNFGHPTTDVVKKYDDLASRVGTEVGKNRKGVLSDETAQEVVQTFEASMPLHFNFNGFLNDSWTTNLEAYSGSKRQIALYSVMRSQTTKDFTGVKVGTSTLNDILKAVSGRPAEVHHILFKAIHPTLANQVTNLMLTQRSKRESEFGPGQHELMHMVASGNHDDKFRQLLPQYVKLYTDWIIGQVTGGGMVVSGKQ